MTTYTTELDAMIGLHTAIRLGDADVAYSAARQLFRFKISDGTRAEWKRDVQKRLDYEARKAKESAHVLALVRLAFPERQLVLKTDDGTYAVTSSEPELADGYRVVARTRLTFQLNGIEELVPVLAEFDDGTTLTILLSAGFGGTWSSRVRKTGLGDSARSAELAVKLRSLAMSALLNRWREAKHAAAAAKAEARMVTTLKGLWPLLDACQLSEYQVRSGTGYQLNFRVSEDELTALLTQLAALRSKK